MAYPTLSAQFSRDLTLPLIFLQGIAMSPLTGLLKPTPQKTEQNKTKQK